LIVRVHEPRSSEQRHSPGRGGPRKPRQ
jgi:hypothetical protein